MKNYLAAICLFVGFTSCQPNLKYSDSTSLEWNDFPAVYPVHGTEVKLDEELLRPSRCYFTDQKLILKDDSEDYLLHFYEVNHFRKAGSYFTFGNGPDEYLWINNVWTDDSSLWVSDLRKSTVHRYKRSDFIKNIAPSELMAEKVVRLQDPYSSLVSLPDSSFLTLAGDIRKKRISHYDKNGIFLETAGEFPTWQEELSPFELLEGFRANLVLSPDKKSVFLFYMQTDLIEQYDLQGELLKRLHGPEMFFPAVKQMSHGTNVHVSSVAGKSRDAYFSPLATGDKIYVLYSGEYFNPEKMNYLKKHLFVFDKAGKPICRYELDQPIFSFTIDEQNQILYGISDQPEFHILKFELGLNKKSTY